MFSQVNATNTQSVCTSTSSHPKSSSKQPMEIANEEWKGDYAYSSYLSEIGEWETRGCPQPGMHEYQTECRDIARVFSYQEGENETDSWIMSGELEDCSVFYFEGECDFTGFDCRGGGEMIIAPTWENLFDNLTDDELLNFVKHMNKNNPPELTKEMRSLSERNDLSDLISKLKEVFSTV
ncbi:hypothetical protein [Endozoicomonas sp. YOMI1]|uniref:hypothetical protein n=1 Tax=Endozoicomonas sp. YOMI1 TaxID=2828739 RepID=UPI002148E2C9|nr:hypothetical protein [Endozoicomonas sp. YOMI1]